MSFYFHISPINIKKGQTQCRRLPHEWGLGKRKTEASLPPQICGEVSPINITIIKWKHK